MKRNKRMLIGALGLVAVAFLVLGVLQTNRPALDSGFSFSPETPTSSVWVRFDAAQALEPDGSKVRFDWDFGDGTEETGGTVYHRFSLPGVYLVELTAVGSDGSSKSDARWLTVEAQAYTSPVAVFTVMPRTAAEGEIVRFQAFSFCRPECTIIEYTWDFGDGTSQLGAAQRHAFTRAGSYLVRLTVTDISGAEDVATQEVRVYSAKD